MELSNNKLRLLQVARRQLNLTEDDYRAILLNTAGVASAKALNDYGFDAVMNRMNALGFKSTSPRKPFGERAGMASERQTAFIRSLWGEFTNGKGDDKSLGKWLESKFKVSSLRFLTVESAPKVITALMCMKKRKNAPEAQRNTVV